MSNSRDDTCSRVETVVTAPLATLGLDVEAVELTPAGKRRVLRIAVDGDDGVSLDAVADATRLVSETLDETDVMGEHPYTLEVTSRGVDRPLTLPRHWRRNADRLVKVILVDGDEVTGRIGASADEVVTLDVAPDPRAEIAGGPVEVRYADVVKALVQIEFNRPPKEAS